MLTKVLVANRGEIAVRVMRTLRSLGIASVAVHSEADAGALHVQVADEGVLLGPAEARLSYLDVERVVAAAVLTGADAIHPGYGFLSENPLLAEACEAAGLVFIGPDAATIRLMGDKRAARRAVAALDVPVVPGFDDPGADDAALEAAAGAIGFPVMVKPAAGGGGKGMRVVRDATGLAPALASARREAAAAFGDDSLLLERYLPRARHVEVQVMGDGEGGAVHFGTRDCSLQRRHQKVVEEAPAPFLPDAVREALHACAVAIARSVRYRGAGTVEFVLDADDPTTWYFLEMNTRLQVEHPVTEAVTGADLVALQLRVAAGEPLGLEQDDVVVAGAAVEARVYAEDPRHRYLPSSGTLLAVDLPDGARVDSGVRAGDTVGTWYDPLLLKVIAAGPDRGAALDRLDGALAGTAVLGLAHNIGSLRALLADRDVRSGAMTTSLIDERGAAAVAPASDGADDARAIAAALLLAARREAAGAGSPWYQRPGWRVGAMASAPAVLVDDDGREHRVLVRGPSTAAEVLVDGRAEPEAAALLPAPAGRALVQLAGRAEAYAAAIDATGGEPVVWLGQGGDAWSLRASEPHRMRRPDDAGDGEGELRSPMPGSVVLVPRAAGEAVREGEVVAVVEAMKMEYPVVSPFDGTLASVDVRPGAQVVRGQVLAVVHPEGAGDPGAPGPEGGVA